MARDPDLIRSLLPPVSQFFPLDPVTSDHFLSPCRRRRRQVNQPKFNQRRISSAKFLGELYNYRMVESAVIFRTLFSFISFGINQDGSPSSLDPPEHLFRIRLVCTLLDTCGQYFDRGSSKKKLDCFLIYFQARSEMYWWGWRWWWEVRGTDDVDALSHILVYYSVFIDRRLKIEFFI